MYIRKSSKKDIAETGVKAHLVACDGITDKVVGYLQARPTIASGLQVTINTLVAASHVLKVTSSLLNEFVKANCTQKITLGSRNFCEGIQPVVSKLGFIEEPGLDAWVRPASQVIGGHALFTVAAEDEPDTQKGFVTDIEKDTKDNTDFRRVLYTGEHLQLVLMSLQPGEDIGEETHEDVDQFFRVDAGEGTVIINGVEHKIKNGSAFVIPAGALHNVVNDGDAPLQIYTVYGGPNHKDGIVHGTKAEALENEEHFDGVTTESRK
jgi:mannose-6-phosphate isomerase-like protein (cupin superfamily)